MAKVLVTGSTGLLGATLVPALEAAGYAVVRHSHASSGGERVDLTQRGPALAFLRRHAPDTIINLAALTDVDRCESDIDAASRVNVALVENLAWWIAHERPYCHLVQVSTDMVYDGPGPHQEDAVVLRNVYALSKYAGELAAVRIGATVLRTNFFGRSACPGRASFTDWIWNSLRQGRPITAFDDVQFSPLSMTTLSAMTCRVLQVRPAGVFNLGSRDGMSKADFVLLFATSAGLPTHTIRRGRFSDVPALQARRPTDMRMESGRIECALGLVMPTLGEEIHLCQGEYVE